jgi:hypothetical protein
MKKVIKAELAQSSHLCKCKFKKSSIHNCYKYNFYSIGIIPQKCTSSRRSLCHPMAPYITNLITCPKIAFLGFLPTA